MKINEIYLKNFKAISEENFNFKNINLITGNSGEGKTAVIEALAFALTNDLKDNISEYVKWGSDKFIISINFDHNSHNYFYTIVGSNKSTTKRELIIDNDINTIFLNSDAVKEIETIIDPILTLYSNISMQHKSTALLEEKSTPRLQKLKQILKVDELMIAIEKIKDDVSILKIDIIEAETKFKILKAKTFVYTDVPDMINEDKYDELVNNLTQLYSDKDIYDKELIEYEVYKTKLQQYTDAETKLIEFKDIKNINIEKIDNLKIKLIEEPKFDMTVFHEFDKLQMNFFNIEQIRNKLIQSIENKSDELKNMPKSKRLKKCQFIDDDIEKINDKIILLENNYTIVNKEIKLIKQGKCPTCGQDYKTTEFYTDDALDIIQEDISIAKKEKEKRKNIIKIYNSEKIENEQFKKDRSIKQKEIDILKNDLKNTSAILFDEEEFNIQKKIKIKYEQILNKNKVVKDEIVTFNNILISTQSAIDEYNKIKKPKKFIFSTKFCTNTFNTVKKEVEELNVLKNEIKNIRKLNADIREEEVKTETQITELDSQLLLKNKKERLLKEVSKILDKDFSSYLIEKGTKHIRDKMNDFFQRSYGKYSVEFKQNKRGIDYYYSENNSDLHSVSTLSGFEQCVFAISQRVALSSLQNLGIFVGDEIDSDTNADNSIPLFKTLLKEDIEQYFFITHNEETKEFLENEGGKVFNIIKGKLL